MTRYYYSGSPDAGTGTPVSLVRSARLASARRALVTQGSYYAAVPSLRGYGRPRLWRACDESLIEIDGRGHRV